ncbi:MAG: hypothetical protein U9R41_06400 [Candidatus Marinimicrobia bacterium]|nr:hypothetical protein [Candidatus Neomarinimicrobiota bacterium]
MNFFISFANIIFYIITMENEKINYNNHTLLQWRIYPLKENPLKGTVAGIFILIVSIYSCMLMNNILFFFIILIVFFIFVLLPYYFPTKFILTDQKVIVQNGPFTKEHKWEYFRRFDYDKKMLKLYTSLSASRLDNYRALNLIFDNNRDQIIEIVKRKIEK